MSLCWNEETCRVVTGTPSTGSLPWFLVINVLVSIIEDCQEAGSINFSVN